MQWHPRAVALASWGPWLGSAPSILPGPVHPNPSVLSWCASRAFPPAAQLLLFAAARCPCPDSYGSGRAGEPCSDQKSLENAFMLKIPYLTEV